MGPRAPRPIVWAMDTLKTPFAPAAPRSVLPWRATLQRLAGIFNGYASTDEDRFLAGAQDLSDLERRVQHLERDGLPAVWPLR